MLHDHHGITLVPELLERSYQLAVIPLMQADARLIQDIKNIHKLRTYLGREPDALALSS